MAVLIDLPCFFLSVFESANQDPFDVLFKKLYVHRADVLHDGVYEVEGSDSIGRGAVANIFANGADDVFRKAAHLQVAPCLLRKLANSVLLNRQSVAQEATKALVRFTPPRRGAL